MRWILLASTVLASPALAASISTSQTQQPIAPQSPSQIQANPPSPAPVPPTAAAPTTCPTGGSVNYSISGLPTGTYSFALQQANGTYDILLWDEGSPGTATVSFPASANVKVYDPTVNATPTQTLNTAPSVQLALTDHMLIVELPASAGGSGKPAMPASSFINSIGVNQHLAFGGTIYQNAPLEIQEMAYLGLKLVRDSAPQSFTLSLYQQVAAAGIQSDFITGPAGQDMANTLPDEISSMAALERSNPGSIVSVEGPNELNGQLVYLNGAASTSGPNVAVAIQQTVAQTVRGNSTLSAAGVKVVNVSITNGIPWLPYTQGLGNLDSSVDQGNWHIYNNLGTQPLAHVIAMLPDALMSAPGKPIAVTEGGYFTAQGDPDGVSPATQAKYNLNFLADDYAHGVVRTFLYELMDGTANPASDDVQGTFGLFLADGTPKPSGTTIHNLTFILGVATSTDPDGCAVVATSPSVQTQTAAASTGTVIASQAPAVREKYLPTETTNITAQAQLAAAAQPATPTQATEAPTGTATLTTTTAPVAVQAATDAGTAQANAVVQSATASVAGQAQAISGGQASVAQSDPLATATFWQANPELQAFEQQLCFDTGIPGNVGFLQYCSYAQ